MPSRRPPRQRWRRRLETEGEEVWGREGARGRGRDGGWLGGGAGGRAGGCSCRQHLGGSRLPGGRSAERSTAEPREAARAPAPNPEPRASAAAAAASRQRVPGRAAAAARKAAGAQQVASALLRPGKVSLAAAGRSWRGVQPLPLEGRGLRTSVPCVRPAPTSPGTWRLHARSPWETVGHGRGWGWDWGDPRTVPGKPWNQVLLKLALGGSGRCARPRIR